VAIQFLIDHIQRKSKTGLISELRPAIDQTRVAAGLKVLVGPLKLLTMVQRLAVLSTAHKLKRLANPCELPSVRTLLSQARRVSVKHGERLPDRDYPGLARDDACDLRWQHGRPARSRPALHWLCPVAGARAAKSRLRICGTCARLVMRATSIGPALFPRSVASIVKHRAKLAGLKGDFGAHILRSGFFTEAGKQGVPLLAVMAMTEHRAVASVIGYFQSGAAEDNPAGRLLK